MWPFYISPGLWYKIHNLQNREFSQFSRFVVHHAILFMNCLGESVCRARIHTNAKRAHTRCVCRQWTESRSHQISERTKRTFIYKKNCVLRLIVRVFVWRLKNSLASKVWVRVILFITSKWCIMERNELWDVVATGWRSHRVNPCYRTNTESLNRHVKSFLMKCSPYILYI